MILQALTEYYEALAAQGEISVPGWSTEKVSYALELDKSGKPLRIYPIKTLTADGKKMVPQNMVIPARLTKTSGKRSNFLCENVEYLLGVGKNHDEERGKACFDCAKELHHAVLDGVDRPEARAICAFFDSWDASVARGSPLLQEHIDELEKGSNIVLMVDGRFAHEYEQIKKAWQRHYDGTDDESADSLRCLVTGERVVPQKVHPSIKGVDGAKPSGAALISFNAPSFCSFNRDQSENAPVGKYAAFAYTSALNQLIADKRHSRRIGDTTVLFWSKDAKREYQDIFADFFYGGNDETLRDEDILALMNKLAHGDPIDFNSSLIDPKNEFFILGLSPNAARLSVRFFLRSNFGDFIKNLESHYERTEIVSDGRSNSRCIPLWALLNETVNENARTKTPSPHMAADTLRAVLLGTRYPSTLYQRAQLRIRADRKVTRGRAAIIKAYLLKNYPNKEFKEALQVKLNEKTTYLPYILGRLFSVLEYIQQLANPDIKATIRDKYFSSACSTPSVVFPFLIKLAQNHLKKLDDKYRDEWEGQLIALANMMSESYPSHLDSNDQGVFQLGYYHQTQKRPYNKNKVMEEK